MIVKPKVTVIIPTYNGADFLAAAIDSVLAQTLRDLQLLVLDNASTDDTPALVGGYTDPRIEYRRNAANLGLAGNVELGCGLATGDYVTILGADDLWKPRFLEAAVAVLDTDAALSMVHGPAAWIDENGRRFGGTGKAWPKRRRGGRAMLGAFEDGFCFSTMVMRGRAVAEIGTFDSDWQEIIDLWLFLRMCLAGDVAYLPEILCEYRVHSNAMSMPMYRQNLMFRRQMKAANEAFAWPRARAIGAAGYRRNAHRSAARIAMEVMHMARDDGMARYLRNLSEVVREVPAILLEPRSWARIGFGLLPLPIIRGLQRHRRRTAIGKASTAKTLPVLEAP